jgi:hypothetical protein
VLEVQNALMLTRIQRWAGRASGNPASVVEKLFAEFAAWARRPGWRGSGFTRAAMEFAHLPGHPARVAARRHKAAVESWLAEELGGNRTGAARQLARQIMLLIEGCHSLILIQGDAGYADAAAEVARLLVKRHRTAKSALGPAKRRR